MTTDSEQALNARLEHIKTVIESVGAELRQLRQEAERLGLVPLSAPDLYLVKADDDA